MSAKREKTCRLTELPVGEVVHVSAVDGGHRVTARLSDMGLFPGTEIEKLRGNGSGPVIIRIGPGRLALGRGVAEKVIVERIG
ncbi:MAG: ferrous iron transport protein A [Planctomycetota bacterium]